MTNETPNKYRERKVVNLLKEDFDFIKQYCNEQCLNMCLWIGKVVRNEIENQRNKKNETKI